MVLVEPFEKSTVALSNAIVCFFLNYYFWLLFSYFKAPLPSQRETKISLDKAPVSSQDSINAILQSDLENVETDNDDMSVIKSMTLFTPKNQDGSDVFKSQTQSNFTAIQSPVHEVYGANVNTCFVSGNQNLIVNHLSDNFQCQSVTVGSVDDASLAYSKTGRKVNKLGNKNRELEKRKLSQNLDNFSVRLGKNTMTSSIGIKDADLTKMAEDRKSADTKNAYIKDKSPPSMLPGWDSCDEYQSPPIENEEWLAFLYRSMQEILDGEIDSLKQQNLVSFYIDSQNNTIVTTINYVI